MILLIFVMVALLVLMCITLISIIKELREPNRLKNMRASVFKARKSNIGILALAFLGLILYIVILIVNSGVNRFQTIPLVFIVTVITVKDIDIIVEYCKYYLKELEIELPKKVKDILYVTYSTIMVTCIISLSIIILMGIWDRLCALVQVV